MNYTRFLAEEDFSLERICRDIYQNNRDVIKIKKEDVAVRNLAVILKATLKLSFSRGFHAMSTRDLSRETGISMGALYSSIGGKEDLLNMFHKEGNRLIGDIMLRRTNSFSAPDEKLQAAVRTHLYLSEALPRVFYFYYMEARTMGKKQQLRAMQAELATEQIFVDILAEGIRCGLFREVDPLLRAAHIKALIQDWYLKRWKYSRRKMDVETYASEIIEFLNTFLLLRRTEA
jgi:AcrR family transcriptional regulator